MIIRNSVSANVAHRCLNAADVRLSDLEEAFGMKNGAHLPERSERLGAIREADLRSRAEADVDSGSARGGGRRGVGDGGAGSARRGVAPWNSFSMPEVQEDVQEPEPPQLASC